MIAPVVTLGVFVAVHLLLGMTIIDTPLRFVAYVVLAMLVFGFLIHAADSFESSKRSKRFDIFDDEGR